MATLKNRVKFLASTSGTADFGIGAALTGFRTPAQAGYSNGQTVPYIAESSDRSEWETGLGTYNTTGPVLERTTVRQSSNADAKVDFSAAPRVFVDPLAEDLAQIGDIREKLTANRTYYVRTDGSDSNTGLVDSAGGAFLTSQKAIDTVLSIDISTYDVTIDVADGTYNGSIDVNAAWVGSGTVKISGNTTTPANVVINNGSGNAIAVGRGARLSIEGIKLTATSGHGAYIEGILSVVGNTEFGACTYGQLTAGYGGTINVTANYRITGAAQQHWYTIAYGSILCQSITVTITGTPAFGVAFAMADTGFMVVNANTFSGGATGPRYIAQYYGLIQTYGAGATYLPGDSAGTATTGTYA